MMQRVLFGALLFLSCCLGVQAPQMDAGVAADLGVLSVDSRLTPCSRTPMAVPAVAGEFESVRTLGIVPLNGGRFGILNRVRQRSALAPGQTGNDAGASSGRESLVLQMFSVRGVVTQMTLVTRALGFEGEQVFWARIGVVRQRTVFFFSAREIGRQSAIYEIHENPDTRSGSPAFSVLSQISTGRLEGVHSSPTQASLQFTLPGPAGGVLLGLQRVSVNVRNPDEPLQFGAAGTYREIASDALLNPAIGSAIFNFGPSLAESYFAAYRDGMGIRFSSLPNSPVFAIPAGADLIFLRSAGDFELMRSRVSPDLIVRDSNGNSGWDLRWFAFPYLDGGNTGTLNVLTAWAAGFLGRGVLGSGIGTESLPPSFEIFPPRTTEQSFRSYVLLNTADHQLQSGRIERSGTLSNRKSLSIPMDMEPVTRIAGVAAVEPVAGCNQALMLFESASGQRILAPVRWEDL